MENLIARMRDVKLTRTQKEIANYILDHLYDACFVTSTSLAGEIGVSEASVIRFSRALGFSGYMEFQSKMRQAYQNRVTEVSDAITVPAEKLIRHAREQKNSDFRIGQYQEVIDNLKSAFNDNTEEMVERAADIIVKSKCKYVAATRGNTALGDYFHLYLKQMLPHVELTTAASVSPMDQMVSIGPKDCLILFSFPRYSTLDRLTAQMAKDAGAAIVVITDRPGADLAGFATVLLTAPIEISTFFNSMVAPQFLSELLLNAVSRRTENLEERLRKIDHYLDKLGNY